MEIEFGKAAAIGMTLLVSVLFFWFILERNAHKQRREDDHRWFTHFPRHDDKRTKEENKDES